MTQQSGQRGNIRGATVFEHATDADGAPFTILEPPPRPDRAAAAAQRRGTDDFLSDLDARHGVPGRDLSPDELAAQVRRSWRGTDELTPDQTRAASADIRARRAAEDARIAAMPPTRSGRPRRSFWQRQRQQGVSTEALRRLAGRDLDLRPVTLAIDSAADSGRFGSSAAVRNARRKLGELAGNPLTAVGLGGAAYMSLAAALLGAASSPRLGGAVARIAGDAARFAAPFLDASTAVPAVSRALASVLGETPDYRDGGLAAALAR